jgi:Erv1 / Alr family
MIQTNTLGIYGPKLWFIIHYLCYRYKANYNVAPCFLTFLHSIQELIPCIKCRSHFQENWKNFPPNAYIKVSGGLFLWSYLMHERVNSQINKQGIPYPVALEYYTQPSTQREFGPNLWVIIHTFASGYENRPSQKTCFKLFIECISKLTPWNINHWLTKVPLTPDKFTSAEALLMWSYILHDTVNQSLGKQSPPFSAVKAFYLARCSTKGGNTVGCGINFNGIS